MLKTRGSLIEARFTQRTLGAIMDNALLVTLITVGGSIAAAIITGIATLVTELVKSGKIGPDSGWTWMKRLGYPLAVVVIIVGGSLVFYLQYDGTTSRLSKALPNVPFYAKRIYPNVGIGF